MKRGRAAPVNERNGTAKLFMLFAPLAILLITARTISRNYHQL
jgi:hypothetical protein